MRNGLRRQNSGKWTPLIALPILLAVCFLLWISLAPADALSEQMGAVLGFPAIFVMGGYLVLLTLHLTLFLVQRSFRANLFFAAASLVWLMRIGIQLPDVFPAFAPEPGSILSIRLILIALPISSVLFLGIFCKLFPEVVKKLFVTIFSVLMAIFVLVFLFFSESVIMQLRDILIITLALAGVFFFINLLVRLRKIGPDQLCFLFGAAIFVIGAFYAQLWRGDLLPAAIRYLNQNNMLIFTLFVSVALVIATGREILEANAQRQRMEAQDIITENQLDFQREQFARLMENMESARFMRHDMKHHLAVISEYVRDDNVSGIGGYLEGLELGLNKARGKLHCDNYAVNAVVNYYLSFAENNGVKAKIKLTVPSDTGLVKDTDLCVIVGNLLENAVEACKNVPKEHRFIRLFSYVQDTTLTFTMENSFDGEFKEWGGIFYSTKRDGEGIGLSSVSAVANRYGGAARFETQGDVFLSSAYVDMGDFRD